MMAWNFTLPSCLPLQIRYGSWVPVNVGMPSTGRDNVTSALSTNATAEPFNCTALRHASDTAIAEYDAVVAATGPPMNVTIFACQVSNPEGSKLNVSSDTFAPAMTRLSMPS